VEKTLLRVIVGGDVLKNMERLVFRPVPSRRLGRSLGVNNIPPKTCSYSCVYCQLGRTSSMLVDRRVFYEPEQILMQVEKKIDEAASRGERIDYITFVPDGEPTLDINLGKEVSLLKHIRAPIAIITNASLLWRGDVREDLLAADFVSLKVDAVSLDLWRRINKWVKPAKEENINAAFQIFAKRLGNDRVEYLIGYEGNAFASTGDIREDLLSITAVHPMREEAVKELLRKNGVGWQIIDELLRNGELVKLEYEGNTYYIRKLVKNK